FTGAGPAAQAVLAGTTQLAAVNIGTVISLIKAGQLRALVQTGKERWFDLPDVPTLAEAGGPNAASETVQALLAPPGPPGGGVGRRHAGRGDRPARQGLRRDPAAARHP